MIPKPVIICLFISIKIIYYYTTIIMFGLLVLDECKQQKLLVTFSESGPHISSYIN